MSLSRQSQPMQGQLHGAGVGVGCFEADRTKAFLERQVGRQDWVSDSTIIHISPAPFLLFWKTDWNGTIPVHSQILDQRGLHAGELTWSTPGA